MEREKILDLLNFLKKRVGRFLLYFFILYCLVFLSLTLIEKIQSFSYFVDLKFKELSSHETSQEGEEEGGEGAEEKENFTDKPDSIEIPKINIKAPIVLANNSEQEALGVALKQGVVHYPSSKLPGEEGQVIILGHSAPAGWPNINYDRVFSELNKLEPGDEVFVNFQKRQYIYQVNEKFFLEKGEEIPQDSEEQESTLYLISCWPPGRDIRRIAIKALIRP